MNNSIFGEGIWWDVLLSTLHFQVKRSITKVFVPEDFVWAFSSCVTGYKSCDKEGLTSLEGIICAPKSTSLFGKVLSKCRHLRSLFLFWYASWALQAVRNVKDRSSTVPQSSGMIISTQNPLKDLLWKRNTTRKAFNLGTISQTRSLVQFWTRNLTVSLAPPCILLFCFHFLHWSGRQSKVVSLTGYIKGWLNISLKMSKKTAKQAC